MARRIDVGLIGAGRIGRVHAEDILAMKDSTEQTHES